MKMDLISNSEKPKRSVQIYGTELSGFGEYTPYETESEIDKHMPKYNNAVKNSTTSGVVRNAKKNSRKSNDSPRDAVRRVLAFVLVGAVGLSAGVMMEKTGVTEKVGASMHRVFDNDEMHDLADQFWKKYDVRTHLTDDHMNYFFDDGYIKEILKEPVVTPDIIAATYVATGSMAEAFNVLNHAVDAGKFVGDPETLKDALYNNWNVTRHELTTKFKAADSNLDKLVSDSALAEYNSGKGAK